VGRVYLVDEQTIVRAGLKALLESAAHEVVGEAANPTTALADVRRVRPDVVLLDLVLGDRSGLELLSALRGRTQAACVVLTTSDRPRDVTHALRLGAAGYVLKNSAPRELLAALDAVLRGWRHLGPGVTEAALDAIGALPAADPFAPLSVRERQIVTLVVRGRSSAHIARELHLSPKTVDTYRSRLMKKLGVAHFAALVRLAVRHGLVDE
jgi:two-component system invasion response regulator UvrY